MNRNINLIGKLMKRKERLEELHGRHIGYYATEEEAKLVVEKLRK